VRGLGLDGDVVVAGGSTFVSGVGAGVGVGSGVGVDVTSFTGSVTFSSWTGSDLVASGLVLSFAFPLVSVSGFRFLLIISASNNIYDNYLSRYYYVVIFCQQKY
jgi:hypothetical protein